MKYTDIRKGFGLALKNWRGKTGISQEELVFRAGLHRSYIADIERGARNASLQSIEKLARALKLSLPQLFQPLGEPIEPFDPPSETRFPNAPLEILLVEDDPRDVELTLAAFKSARLTNPTYVLRDGAEALDFVFCRGIHAGRTVSPAPQLMLMDLNLPKVHGLEVLRTLKNEVRFRPLRVAILTMSCKDEHIAQALALGAEAYIVKPVDFRNLSEITPDLELSWSLGGADTAAPRRAIETTARQIF